MVQSASSLFLDVHHIQERAEGGGHALQNLVTVCGAHHRAIHRGQVLLEGSFASELRMLHADGTPYAGALLPKAALVRDKVMGALTGMGFRKEHVKRALDHADHPQLGSEASLETLFRRALSLLTESVSPSGTF